VAACPHDAITHAGMDMRGFAPATSCGISAEQMAGFLSSKRSVRLFSDKLVDRTAIERLIQVARMAPSAHNGQNRGFVVLLDAGQIATVEAAVAGWYRRLLIWLHPAVLGALSLFAPRLVQQFEEAVPDLKRMVLDADRGASPIFRGAPCVIFIHGPKADPLARDDCLAAQHYLMLQAHAMGLGTCIIGYATVAARAVQRHLRLPRGHRVFAATILGHPAVTFRKTVDRRPPLVTWQ
jgi:nitroreductase